MKVVLKQEVPDLGLAGDIVDVADGYGRNYLLPRGFAIRATRGALKQAETLVRSRKAQEAKTLGAAEEYRDALQGRTLRIAARVDDKGHLYGSVGPVEVQRVLKERGHDVDRRRIELRHHIKEIGAYTVPIHLHPQVTAQVRLEVIDVEGKVGAGPETADDTSAVDYALGDEPLEQHGQDQQAPASDGETSGSRGRQSPGNNKER